MPNFAAPNTETNILKQIKQKHKSNAFLINFQQLKSTIKIFIVLFFNLKSHEKGKNKEAKTQKMYILQFRKFTM